MTPSKNLISNPTVSVMEEKIREIKSIVSLLRHKWDYNLIVKLYRAIESL